MIKYWVWLSVLKGIGPITARKLLNHFHAPERIYYSSKQELLEVNDIGEATSVKIINSRSLSLSMEIMEKCRKHNIKILCMDNPLYTGMVKSIKYQ